MAIKTIIEKNEFKLKGEKMEELFKKVWEMGSARFIEGINLVLLHFGMGVIIVFVIVLIFIKYCAQLLK